MTQPVGPDYGLEPRLNHTPPVPTVDSRDLVSEYDYREGSEYGGVPGVIQPAPHVPTATERLRMIYALDPLDDGTQVGSVAAPELDGLFDPR
jgi:hypothetical protein